MRIREEAPILALISRSACFAQRQRETLCDLGHVEMISAMVERICAIVCGRFRQHRLCARFHGIANVAIA